MTPNRVQIGVDDVQIAQQRFQHAEFVIEQLF